MCRIFVSAACARFAHPRRSLLLVFTVFAAVTGGQSFAKEPPMPDFERISGPVHAVATGELNRMEAFLPSISVGGEWGPERHTPMVKSNLPWDPEDTLWIEVPEYVWANVPGDPHGGSPFYYGRALSQTAHQQWTLRYPSLEPPSWREEEGNVLALDNPLEGGYIQRFRVIPSDRMLEVRVGITNNSDKPLENLRTQLCAKPQEIESLKERWPTTSRMLSDGEPVTWDSTGQSLDWLHPFYNAETGRFSRSCFFLAPAKGSGEGRNQADRTDLMYFDQDVDLPAIAKTAPLDEGQRSIVVYSPFARASFYNCLAPCFHADPHIHRIGSGETRWMTAYYLFHEGDVGQLLAGLAEIHEERKTQEGILE